MAAVICTSCTSIAEQHDVSLCGKVLVMEYESAEKVFPFPDSDDVHRKVRHLIAADTLSENAECYPYHTTEINYNYNPETKEFYEESRVTHPCRPVHDGYGYSKWRLHFTSANKGEATLIAKHPRGLRRYKVGQTVSFRIEPVSSELHVTPAA